MAQSTPFEYDLEVLPKAKLGIDPRVVEMMLEEAKTEWKSMESTYQQELAELRTKVSEMESERSTIQAVLIGAQKSAEQTMRQAQAEADKLVGEATEVARREEAERAQRLENLQQEVQKYTQMKHAVTQDIRAMLESYLRDLDQNLAQKMGTPGTSAPQPEAKPETPETSAQEPQGDMISAHGFGEAS